MADLKVINKAIRSEATSRLKGYLYQFMVALDSCFELGEGQSLYVETYGDLAIKEDGSDDQNKLGLSMEIKMYNEKNELHLKHHNFLNTLFNWIQDNFHFEQYKQLVLFSTQTTRVDDKLFDWNKKEVSERYKVVYDTYSEYIEKNEAFLNKEKKENPKSKHLDIELNIKQMKGLLYSVCNDTGEIDTDESKSRLSSLLDKVVILEKRDGYIDFYEKQLVAKRSNFNRDKSIILINSLLGFILNPALVDTTWCISHEEFQKELNMLANMLGGEKLKFPSIIIPDEITVDEDALFVKKLRDIGWKKVEESVKDYAFASKFIEEEAEITAVKSSFEDFKSNLVDVYENLYGIECENLTADVLSQSRAFVFKVFNSARSVNFSIYEHTDPKFRKGVYHSMANEECNNIVWKIE